MKSDYIMTKQQADEKIKCLEEVFDVVRLLDADTLQVVDGNSHENYCECYKFWDRNTRCENCISSKAVKFKTQKTKLEYFESQIYQVIAKYVEIDNKPYSMEMIKCMDDDSMLVGSEGRDKLVSKIAGYEDKLYEDVLTGAYNRRYYEEKIKNLDYTAGVAVIDLDDFKIYNDTYGHNAGDAALITAANVIRDCIRKTDKLIRYGGDEFLLVLPGADEQSMGNILRRIRREINNADVHGYSKMKLSVSIGGVLSQNEQIENVIAKADKLMYQAKSYKNMVVTEQDIIGESSDKENQPDREKMKAQILIVDDAEINREFLSEILKEDYHILQASNGKECMDILQNQGTGIALILLDIVMPEMDGFEVLSQMNRNHLIEDVPVIMISSEDADQTIRRAYEMGVSDYISSPFDTRIVYRRVFNTIKLYAKQRRLISIITESINEKEKNNRMMIAILGQIVEFRNCERGMHVNNINVITQMLLEKLIQKTDKYKLSWNDRTVITTASAFHDIGKICIDEKILNKPERLTKEEFEIMKTHAIMGSSMLEKLDMYQNERILQTAAEICRWHHERYDGQGYPDGLKGDEIPISAQVVSVADVYDALTSERVYKKAFSHEKAMEMILNGECGTFNPILLECLSEIQDKLIRFLQEK